MAKNSFTIREALQCLVQMNQKSFTPDSTTVAVSSPGFCRGMKPLGTSHPSVPGREFGGRSVRGKVPCGRIWPNGEFGLSYHVRTEEQDDLPDRAPGPNRLPSDSLQLGLFWHLLEQWVVARAQWDYLVWLVKSVKSARRPATYGRKGITAYGQKVVRSGAYLLQEKYGKDRLCFATFTLPRLSRRSLRLVAGKWGYLVKTLLQGLRRLLKTRGLPESVVLVTELQPGRLKRGDMGALHLHLCFVAAHRPFCWEFSPFVYKSLWLRMLSNLLGRTIPCYPCENIQRVKKDASQYLSKYMSKGSSDIADYAEMEGWRYVPRQWWSATSPVKKAVKKYTMSGGLASGILDQVIENWQKNGYLPNTEGVVFCRPITTKATQFQDYLIGFFGKIDKETYADIRGMVSMLKSA